MNLSSSWYLDPNLSTPSVFMMEVCVKSLSDNIDTPIVMMKHKLSFLSLHSHHAIGLTKTYINVTTDQRHPLHGNTIDTCIKDMRINCGM
uniref:Uncharacterized protein n=1 Tax=Arion vulgaris TaxID=1028688 RepID=A0A0B7BA03_9EUPU